MRRPLVVGLAAGGLYAAVAVATLLLADRPLLPLFDGLAPPPPYRWVKPPPELAAGNEQPASATRDAPLGAEGSPFLNVTPDDGQATVVLGAGAVPSHPPDTTVRVAVTPHDPGTLGGLPGGLSAAGNAYEVAVTYQPSGASPADLRPTPESSVALTAAGISDVMLYSPDGSGWVQRERPEPLLGGHGLKTSLDAPGYYLVASIDRSPSRGTSPVVYVLLLAAPVVVVVTLVVSKRRREAARARAKADARKRGGRGPADPRSTRRPPPPGRPGPPTR